jgi:hypothetical protein
MIVPPMPSAHYVASTFPIVRGRSASASAFPSHAERCPDTRLTRSLPGLGRVAQKCKAKWLVPIYDQVVLRLRDRQVGWSIAAELEEHYHAIEAAERSLKEFRASLTSGS